MSMLCSREEREARETLHTITEAWPLSRGLLVRPDGVTGTLGSLNIREAEMLREHWRTGMDRLLGGKPLEDLRSSLG